MKCIVWILGRRRGLLGSAIARALPATLPSGKIWDDGFQGLSWDNPGILAGELKNASRCFMEEAYRENAHWAVIWAAGGSFPGSPNHCLISETVNLHLLLSALKAERKGAGTLVFASSAGATYDSNAARRVNENDPDAPFSEYGIQKVEHEKIVRDWGNREPNTRTLILRISNIYGPGQNFQKPQGIISRMSRCSIRRQPMEIFVPLGTVRDYIYSSDCAVILLHCLQRMMHLEAKSTICKILASGEIASIATIVTLFHRLARQKPLLIFCQNNRTGFYKKMIQFKSNVWSDIDDAAPKTSLSIGLAVLHREQLALYRAGYHFNS